MTRIQYMYKATRPTTLETPSGRIVQFTLGTFFELEEIGQTCVIHINDIPYRLDPKIASRLVKVSIERGSDKLPADLEELIESRQALKTLEFAKAFNSLKPGWVCDPRLARWLRKAENLRELHAEGRYEEAADCAINWLAAFPTHPAQGKAGTNLETAKAAKLVLEGVAEAFEGIPTWLGGEVAAWDGVADQARLTAELLDMAMVLNAGNLDQAKKIAGKPSVVQTLPPKARKWVVDNLT